MNILSFFQHRSRKRARKLYDEARELIDRHEYDAALKIARKLRKLRYSGAYEIEGLAYSATDRNEDAVRALREGLERAPSVWLNWLLLGSCLSNLAQFDEAMLAYERAEECGGERTIIDLNRAVVAIRRSDHAAALEYVDRIPPDAMTRTRLGALGCRVTALHALGRDGEAEDLAVRVLREWRDTGEATGKADIGEMALIVGEIRLARGENRMLVFADAAGWWRATRHERLLWLIREALPRPSPDAQYFRLALHGAISPESELYEAGAGYMTWTDVVADSPEEALRFYVELLPLEAGVELTIREVKTIEPRPNGMKGVYAAMGRVFYPEKD